MRGGEVEEADVVAGKLVEMKEATKVVLKLTEKALDEVTFFLCKVRGHIHASPGGFSWTGSPLRPQVRSCCRGYARCHIISFVSHNELSLVTSSRLQARKL